MKQGQTKRILERLLVGDEVPSVELHRLARIDLAIAERTAL